MSLEKELAGRFEANRDHLRAIAFRMLGASGDAEDAVQEAWLRLSRSGGEHIDDLKAWLTTVVARICLDVLRSRNVRRSEPIVEAEDLATGEDLGETVELADSVGVAMLVVLETLSPAERVVFVLHDMFNLPFEDLAPLIGRSPAAARQLASRARRRVRGASSTPDADRTRRRQVVEAFHAASREGNFSALLAVLDPAVVLRSDASAIAASLARLGDAPPLSAELHGREAVARVFEGRARAASPALVDGDPGLVIAFGGTPRMVFDFVIDDGLITEISLIADSAAVAALDSEF